jgi:hypothetical protein
MEISSPGMLPSLQWEYPYHPWLHPSGLLQLDSGSDVHSGAPSSIHDRARFDSYNMCGIHWIEVPFREVTSGGKNHLPDVGIACRFITIGKNLELRRVSLRRQLKACESKLLSDKTINQESPRDQRNRFDASS